MGTTWVDLVLHAAASGHEVLALYPVKPRAAESPGRYPSEPSRVLPTGEELHEVNFTDHLGAHATLLAVLWDLLSRGFDFFGATCSSLTCGPQSRLDFWCCWLSFWCCCGGAVRWRA